MGLGCALTVQYAFCLQLETKLACLIAIEVAIHGSLANPEHLADFVVQSSASLKTLGLLALPPAIPSRQFSAHSITIGSTVTEVRQSARPALPFLLWGVLPMDSFRFEPVSGGGNLVTLPGRGIAPNCFLQGTESAPDTRSAVDPTGKLTWCQQIALTPV
jgi:hypothetical protein